MRKIIHAFAQPGVWAYLLVGTAAFLLFICTYVRAYSPGTGITRLIQIGREFDQRGLAVFRETPKRVDSRWGFDGQFYAELALDPLLRDPQLKTALDSPDYRPRRILLPWLAWLGGLGRPFWILNVYAALNLVFWIGYAGLLGILFRPHGWGGLAGFAAMLMTCGIIESMRASLTDFPSFVLMVGAMMAGGLAGAGWLALSVLTREANCLGLFGLLGYRPPWPATLRRNLILGLVAGLPMALWSLYLLTRFPPSPGSITGGNLTWPLQGIIAKLGEFWVHAVNGDIHWRVWYTELYTSEALHALLTIVSVLTQIAYLLTHRAWDNRFWRAGAIFIPYFLCLSFIPWESHFTITRHALAITLAFNLLLAVHRQRGWLAWFILGNCFVPYGVYVFTLQDAVKGAVPMITYEVVPAQPSGPSVEARFAQGWATFEWNHSHVWHWGVAQHATLVLANPTNQPVEASLAFGASCITSRDLKISVRGTEIWATPALQSSQSVETQSFPIPPGETVVDFDTTGRALKPDLKESRPLTFKIMDLQIRLSPSSPSH